MKSKSITDKHQQQLNILGAFFREYRLNEGLTQSELCNSVNICRKTIQRLESGNNVSLLTSFKVAEYFGIDVLKELFG